MSTPLACQQIAAKVATRREDWERQMRRAAEAVILDQLAAELTYVTTLAERVALVRDYGQRLEVAA
jgi:uncharacterized membrane protein YebE (DUF533 family)